MSPGAGSFGMRQGPPPGWSREVKDPDPTAGAAMFVECDEVRGRVVIRYYESRLSIKPTDLVVPWNAIKAVMADMLQREIRMTQQLPPTKD